MKIIADELFIETLKIEAKKYGFELDQTVCEKLEIYKELLVQWNEKMNLTNITENYEVIVKHFIDCMHCIKYITKENKVIDVGTGAGFPGMVLAIVFKDELDITLLDSLNKRLIFLEEVKNKLELKNVKIIHERAEEGAHKESLREKYDVVLARAVSALNNLLEYTTGYLKVNGNCIFMKGDNYREEINNSKKSMAILNCKLKKVNEYTLKIEDEEYKRVILEIQKYKNTPEKYPRNFGKMKKNPL